MTKDFSNIFAGKQAVKGRFVTHNIGSAGFLAKTVGVTITGVTLCVFSGSMIMGWLIQAGLNDLAHKQEMKRELVKEKQELVLQKQEILTLNNIELAVGGLGLYPGDSTQVRKL